MLVEHHSAPTKVNGSLGWTMSESSYDLPRTVLSIEVMPLQPFDWQELSPDSGGFEDIIRRTENGWNARYPTTRQHQGKQLPHLMSERWHSWP
jgi:hypothetical protein